MYHELLRDASFWTFLFSVDQDIAQRCRSKGCPCGGHLHCADYPRKPRGVPRHDPDPGQLPQPHERPQGCNFGPRCDHFVPGRCDARAVDMVPVPDTTAENLYVRCLRWEEIGTETDTRRGAERMPIEIGEKVLEVDGMQKYYEVHDGSIATLISGKGIHYMCIRGTFPASARRRST